MQYNFWRKSLQNTPLSGSLTLRLTSSWVLAGSGWWVELLIHFSILIIKLECNPKDMLFEVWIFGKLNMKGLTLKLELECLYKLCIFSWPQRFSCNKNSWNVVNILLYYFYCARGGCLWSLRGCRHVIIHRQINYHRSWW